MEIGYVNARVRGMKSRLFDRDFFKKLMRKPDVDAVITELEKTPYKEDIEKASVHSSGIHCIEDGLRMNLVRTYRKILEMVTGEPYEKYVHVMCNIWDVQNIKTVLRGKRIHVSAEEILENLVPAGELDEATFAELVKQPDIKAVLDLMATWDCPYSRPLVKHFEKFAEKRDLAVLEYALDKYYYERTLGMVTGSSYKLTGSSYNDALLRDLFSTEIDIINIKTVLRLIRDRINIEDGKSILIPGGNLMDIPLLEDMIQTGSIEKAITRINATPYAFTNAMSDVYQNKGKIAAFESALDRYLIQKGIATYRGDPLSIAPVIGYIWRKNNEITNIRVISRCKDAFMPEEEIFGELLYV